MATAKELKIWEDREQSLRRSVSIAEKAVERETIELNKAKDFRFRCLKMLEDHLAAQPTLTTRQAARRKLT